ncbi:MAG: hypothetical protein JXC36_01050, partial [Candidatus Atribacteria bacterium]|nr:hypothetical protein [Candidatus Atribacteria bacterium]
DLILFTLSSYLTSYQLVLKQRLSLAIPCRGQKMLLLFHGYPETNRHQMNVLTDWVRFKAIWYLAS